MKALYLQGISIEAIETLIRETVKDVLDETLQTEQKNIPSESNYYLSRKEVSKLLGVSLPTLHKWTQEGKITAYRIGKRVFYKYSDVDNSLVEIKYLKYNRKSEDL